MLMKNQKLKNDCVESTRLTFHLSFDSNQLHDVECTQRRQLNEAIIFESKACWMMNIRHKLKLFIRYGRYFSRAPRVLNANEYSLSILLLGKSSICIFGAQMAAPEKRTKNAMRVFHGNGIDRICAKNMMFWSLQCGWFVYWSPCSMDSNLHSADASTAKPHSSRMKKWRARKTGKKQMKRL